jgi:hypothetical protein
MEDKEILFKLFYHALIEIREEAVKVDNKKIRLISDLFHNVPLSINRDRPFNEIMEELNKKAESINIKGWLDNVKKQLG